MLDGKDDFLTDTPVPLDLQVRRLLSLYQVSRAVAIVVAELAFSKGGEA